MPPSIVGTLIFMLTMTSSQFLMSGLVEEKENRMMEVFMTSARPIEMMSGKLLGMGLLGLTQLGVWGLFGLAYLLVSGQLGDIGKILAALQLTPIFIFVTLIMTLLGYLFYGSILAGIGATVNAEKEAQQYATLIVLGGVAPLALVIVFLLDPNGGAAQLMSVIPLTAPIALIIRLSLATVPTAHILFSMGVMVVSVIVAIYFSARVFRMGMLNYGKGGVFVSCGRRSLVLARRVWWKPLRRCVHDGQMVRCVPLRILRTFKRRSFQFLAFAVPLLLIVGFFTIRGIQEARAAREKMPLAPREDSPFSGRSSPWFGRSRPFARRENTRWHDRLSLGGNSHQRLRTGNDQRLLRDPRRLPENRAA
ncbi:MAG: ABC transporter permease [Anaerolineales bacterium]|nr:ABC transporter permease [Anaerolineales bacterium]